MGRRDNGVAMAMVASANDPRSRTDRMAMPVVTVADHLARHRLRRVAVTVVAIADLRGRDGCGMAVPMVTVADQRRVRRGRFRRMAMAMVAVAYH